MNNSCSIISAFFITVIATSVSVTTVFGQSDTAFTYQGELSDNGSPANGSYNLDFSLWDAATGGNQVGAEEMFNGHSVVDGRFTEELDFRDGAFDNTGRWLEIAVNGDELNPRQPITRSPYSIQTRGIFVAGNKKVGIGTNSPLDQLHVAGDNATLRLEDTTTPGGFTLIEDSLPTQLRISKTNSSGDVFFDMSPIPADGTSNAFVRFFRSTDTDGIKAVRFLRGTNTFAPSASIGVDGEDSYFQIHGGKVGIGTTAPAEELDVIGTVMAEGLRITNGGINTGTFIAPFGNATLIGNSDGSNIIFATDNVFRMLIRDNGNIGIGETLPNFRLDVIGTVRCTELVETSSRAHKEDIVPIKNALETVDCLQGVRFNWKKEFGGTADLGFIAEEVAKVIPELVKWEPSGEAIGGLKYGHLTAIAIEAIKELRTQKDEEIKSVRAENDALRSRLESLETIVEQLVSTAKEQTK